MPYANRITQGRFTYNGVTYDLPRKFAADHPHTLHGTGSVTLAQAWHWPSITGPSCAKRLSRAGNPFTMAAGRMGARSG